MASVSGPRRVAAAASLASAVGALVLSIAELLDRPLLLLACAACLFIAVGAASYAITRFAGSMIFVYVHVVWFALWIGLRVERYPYGLLTMIVSLEAIFLSTFILISQNRADDRREIVANHNWQLVREEEVQNAELIAMAKEILELTRTQHGGQAQRFPRTPPT